MLSDTIHCNRCEADKSPADFTIDTRTVTGYKRWCRECVNTYAKEKRRAASNMSLIEAAFQIVTKGQWPEELGDVDVHKIAIYSGAPVKEVRLYVMRQWIEREEATLTVQQAKNFAEFKSKQQ